MADLVWDGVRCRVVDPAVHNAPRPPQTLLAPAVLVDGAVPLADVDASSAERFLHFARARPDVWRPVNVVVCHGNFLRRLARQLAPADVALHQALRRVRQNHLYTLRATVVGRVFYFMRHCTRTDTGRALANAVDPGCVRSSGAVCGSDELEQTMREAWGLKGHVAVFSSCLRRAVETAEAVLRVVRTLPHVRLTPEVVRVLPFVREVRNWFGPWDRSNACLRSTLDKLRASGAVLRGTVVRVPTDGNCLFHAIAHAERGLTASALRARVVDWVEAHWTSKVAALGGMAVRDLVAAASPRDYAHTMRRDGAWAGVPEIVAAERVLGRPISVVAPFGDGTYRRIHGAPSALADAIYVSYHNAHYDAFELTRSVLPLP